MMLDSRKIKSFPTYGKAIEFGMAKWRERKIGASFRVVPHPSHSEVGKWAVEAHAGGPFYKETERGI